MRHLLFAEVGLSPASRGRPLGGRRFILAELLPQGPITPRERVWDSFPAPRPGGLRSSVLAALSLILGLER